MLAYKYTNTCVRDFSWGIHRLMSSCKELCKVLNLKVSSFQIILLVPIVLWSSNIHVTANKPSITWKENTGNMNKPLVYERKSGKSMWYDSVELTWRRIFCELDHYFTSILHEIGIIYTGTNFYVFKINRTFLNLVLSYMGNLTLILAFLII